MQPMHHRGTDSTGTLHALETRLRELDTLLERRPDPELDRLREKLGRRFDALWAARAVCDRALRLPLCVCGKRCHLSREAAEAHRAALETLKPRRRLPSRGMLPTKAERRPLDVYACPFDGWRVYHVGHLVVRK